MGHPSSLKYSRGSLLDNGQTPEDSVCVCVCCFLNESMCWVITHQLLLMALFFQPV